MLSGWDCFLVYLEWRDVFLGVFVYSSSNDQLGCFVFKLILDFPQKAAILLSDF